MRIFDFRDRLIADYASYVKSLSKPVARVELKVWMPQRLLSNCWAMRCMPIRC